MSYDISLYEAAFLRKAITEGLGDWTGAPDIDPDTIKQVLKLADSEGFVATPHDPGFIEFMKSQALTPSDDYQLNTPQYLVSLQIFSNSIAISAPYSADRAIASVEFTRGFGLRLARAYDFGFQDHQTGEIITESA